MGKRQIGWKDSYSDSDRECVLLRVRGSKEGDMRAFSSCARVPGHSQSAGREKDEPRVITASVYTSVCGGGKRTRHTHTASRQFQPPPPSNATQSQIHQGVELRDGKQYPHYELLAKHL